MNEAWHLYLMAAIYIIAGISHFVKPQIYMRTMPNYLPNHKALVLISGIAEIALGLGLLSSETRDISLIGIILMLVMFLSVHFYMLTSKEAGAGIPKWVLYLRIPLQFVLMYWAYLYL